MYPYTATKKSLHLKWSAWHDYDWQTVQAIAPLAAGVYVLATKLTNGNLRIFYVGQTDSLDRRLKEHLSDSEKNTCLKNEVKNYKCAFRFAQVANAAERDKAERALYKKFLPSCNDSGAIPDVEDVEIDF